METQQGSRHRWYRDKSGTTGTHNGDAIAAAEALTGTVPTGITHALVLIAEHLVGGPITELQRGLNEIVKQSPGYANWSSIDFAALENLLTNEYNFQNGDDYDFQDGTDYDFN